jgi:ACT domain-containing protein
MSRDQQQDKAKLLDRLRRTPIVEVACKQAGVPRSTYYRWRKASKRFREACDEAITEGSGLINDMAESQLINAIKEKNMTAITYWLKSHHKAYANKVEVDAKVHHEQEELTAEQAALVAQALRHAGLLTEGVKNEG